MCVDSFVGVRNVDGTITYIQGRFETNDLDMWLQCNMFNIHKVKNLMNKYFTNEKQQVDSLYGFTEEGLKQVDVIYLLENKHWLKKTKETDWKKIGAN